MAGGLKDNFMRIFKIFLFVLLCANIYAQQQASFDVHRQQFSILKDGDHTILGAELLMVEYPTNTLCDSLLETNNVAKYANTPEYMVSRQIRNISLGNLAAVLEDFEPGDSRETARAMFADVNGLKSFYSDTSGFFFATKVIFEPYVYITYVSSLDKDGNRVTLSAYLKRNGNGYYFVKEPETLKFFSATAGAFPFWEAVAIRDISTADDNNLLDVAFRGNSGNTNLDYNSRVVIKYKLTSYEEGAQASSADKQIGFFLSQMLDAYRNNSTNRIISLWQPGDDQEFIKASIANGEYKATVDYFKKFKDFTVAFYIRSGGEYWVFIVPSEQKSQLKLIRLLKDGDTFKLTSFFPDTSAEEIITSKQMMDALIQQAIR